MVVLDFLDKQRKISCTCTIWPEHEIQNPEFVENYSRLIMKEQGDVANHSISLVYHQVSYFFNCFASSFIIWGVFYCNLYLSCNCIS
ncbi:hypothetical protein HanPI659440_Chr14g0548091 [Helianthus annuus]|nr:hypothetical protein HanPI659440_Chr14g0548091 [Helianthus annuus]